MSHGSIRFRSPITDPSRSRSSGSQDDGFVPFFAVLSFYNWRGLPQMVAGGAAAVVLIVLPFALAGTADGLMILFDPRVPAPDNAPNLWFLLKGSVVSPATIIGFETPLPLRALSYAIWIAVAVEPMRRLCRRGSFEALSLAAAVCAYAFSLFAIGVRERYGFPAAALLIPIARAPGQHARGVPLGSERTAAVLCPVAHPPRAGESRPLRVARLVRDTRIVVAGDAVSYLFVHRPR